MYKNDLESVLENCDKALSFYITAGVDMESSEKSVQLAEKHPKLYAAVGVHPEDAKDLMDSKVENKVDSKKLQKLMEFAESKKVVAIGEIGLDYHYLHDKTPEEIDEIKKVQKMAFISQLSVADMIDFPVVIHSRDAMGDIIKILKQNKVEREGLIHCYSGSVECAKILMELGFSFSFGGVATFKNAKNVKEVIQFLPLNRILLETDCPYLTPEPYRGQRNEPKNVVYVADAIARIKGVSIEEVAKVTTENAKRIFRI
ncbi:MAG: TatD family hydrolase [Clostridia bacterium]|nr:TatD family hydrolase [Clostridia bacterium]